jgi:hypothetical protein
LSGALQAGVGDDLAAVSIDLVFVEIPFRRAAGALGQLLIEGVGARSFDDGFGYTGNSTP